jgi:hypothetical protein
VPDVLSLRDGVGEVGDGEGVAVLGQMGERDIGGALANHEVNGNETLEDDGPC